MTKTNEYLSLHSDHLADLTKSGLSLETIQQAGIYSVRPGDINKKIGFNDPKIESVMAFPYTGCDGFERFKPFPQQVGKKYLQRKGTMNHLYIPQKVRSVLSNPSIPIHLTEGEKKTLKAVQEGIHCIGLGGLWNWSNGAGGLIPDFELVEWKDRIVKIIPDSDWSSLNRDGYKKNLSKAVHKLTQHLITREARVFIVQLPKGDVKIGLDDYLCNHTVDELHKLPTFEVKLSEELKLIYPTSYLKYFELLHKALGLFGRDYIPIGKACWYYLNGQASREVVRFGHIRTDLRFPIAFALPSGHGKLNISSLINKIGQEMGDHISNPTSYHPEQLIGKVIRIENKKEVRYRQVKGHFDSDVLVFDDGIDLIQSKDPVYKESRRYVCKCLDVIGENLLTKKQVDIPEEESLKYYPKCSVILFFQPFPLPEESFLSGVFRRFPIIYMSFDERDFSQEFEQRLEGGSTEDQIEALVSHLLEVKKGTDHPLTFSKDFKESFKKDHSLLVNFGRTFGPKAANYTRMMAFTLQNWLLRMSAIMARSEKRTEVSGWDVERAFIDLLEILDSTFRFVEKKVQGDLDYGESWSGAVGRDRFVLAWLASKGATSEEKSDVTINEYLKKMQEVMELGESGARKNYRRHRNRGWIETKQRQQITRVWLKFKPPEEFIDDFLGDLGVPVSLAYQGILRKIERGEKNNEGDRDTVSPRTPRNSYFDNREPWEATNGTTDRQRDLFARE